MNDLIPRSMLGTLTRIGTGGQGIVYSAPAVRTNVSGQMVFKEYKPPFLAQLDVAALDAMPRFLSGLHPTAAQRLIATTAWNCGLVEEHGTVVGFVMPRIPDQFFWTMTFPGGPKVKTAEVQHLLNEPDVLHTWGHVVSMPERIALIRSVADNLTFLHRLGVIVGDLSPKNLLFSIGPAVNSYFIDTDAMLIGGRAALPPVETPGWSVPAGEPPATVHSDAYKLGLLALRLFVGDQGAKSPSSIPAFTPPLIRQLITDALTAAPNARPLPATWVRALDSIGNGSVTSSPSTVPQPVASRPAAP